MLYRTAIVILAVSSVLATTLACCLMPLAESATAMAAMAMSGESKACHDPVSDNENAGDTHLPQCCVRHSDPAFVAGSSRIVPVALVLTPLPDSAGVLPAPSLRPAAYSHEVNWPPGVHETFQNNSILRI